MYSTIHEYSRRDLIWRLEYIYFPSCTVQYMCIQEGTWFEGWGTYISQAVKYSTCVFRKGPLFGGWGTYIFQAVQNSTCVFRKEHGSEDGVHIYPKLYSTVHVYSGRDLVRRMGYIYIPSCAVQYMCIQEGTWFGGWGTYISQAVQQPHMLEAGLSAAVSKVSQVRVYQTNIIYKMLNSHIRDKYFLKSFPSPSLKNLFIFRHMLGTFRILSEKKRDLGFNYPFKEGLATP